jgi:CO/xanthine dehydrogenase FAD-binding subunit
MGLCKHYFYSTSIEDALKALQESSNSAKLLAGGTDLLLDLQQGRHAPVDTLVDITNIPELNVLEIREQNIFIGAAVPHRIIASSPIIKEHAQALAEASSLIGGPQVRNVATLGGNVAHALPAADGTIALMALDAWVEVASLENRRRIPLADLFHGPGESTLDPQKDLLVGFYIPQKRKNQGSAFERVMRPQGVAIAILNCAVWLHRDEGMIEDIRISIGPSGPVPKRLSSVENVLQGKQFETPLLNEAYEMILAEASFRTSRHRATHAYREEMARVLLHETFQRAWGRCS